MYKQYQERFKKKYFKNWNYLFEIILFEKYFLNKPTKEIINAAVDVIKDPAESALGYQVVCAFA